MQALKRSAGDMEAGGSGGGVAPWSSSFTWWIENFRKLRSGIVRSDSFEAGIATWLQAAAGVTIWLRSEFKFTLVNQADASKSCSHGDTQTFDNQKCAVWGVGDLIPRFEVIHAAAGWLVNDTLVLTVDVTVEREDRVQLDTAHTARWTHCTLDTGLQECLASPFFRGALEDVQVGAPIPVDGSLGVWNYVLSDLCPQYDAPDLIMRDVYALLPVVQKYDFSKLLKRLVAFFKGESADLTYDPQYPDYYVIHWLALAERLQLDELRELCLVKLQGMTRKQLELAITVEVEDGALKAPPNFHSPSTLPHSDSAPTCKNEAPSRSSKPKATALSIDLFSDDRPSREAIIYSECSMAMAIAGGGLKRSAGEMELGGSGRGDAPWSSSFTWRIENFSTLGSKSVLSDSFEAGIATWRLLVYPDGYADGQGTHLGVYLEVQDEMWQPSAEYKFTLLNQADGSKSTHSGMPCDMTLKLPCGVEVPVLRQSLQLASPFFRGALEDVQGGAPIPVDGSLGTWIYILTDIYPLRDAPALTWGGVYFMLPVVHKYNFTKLLARLVDFVKEKHAMLTHLPYVLCSYVIPWLVLAERLQLDELRELCLAKLRGMSKQQLQCAITLEVGSDNGGQNKRSARRDVTQGLGPELLGELLAITAFAS
ncbi:hypothetical protein FOA52_012735 [Chlamydomonas sp. UWO 241]|nr:hypothetical protein FOA52_012735 [Chlamydomonas sp. UWO 241]